MEEVLLQVMASYGQKSTSELLLSYGFCPSAEENPHDACKLRLQLSPDDAQKAAKTDLLHMYGFETAQVSLSSISPDGFRTHVQSPFSEPT